MLVGNKPYFILTGRAGEFETHRHPEIEISFCLEGAYDIICENKRYSLKEGDFAVILPMTAHEIPPDNGLCNALFIEVGYALLGDFFESFTNQNETCFIYKKSEIMHLPLYKELAELMVQTSNIHSSDSKFGELLIKGNLYKISALLLQMLDSSQNITIQNKKITDIKKIDKALEIIHSNYYNPLNVEEVSAVCGYSKSNFCKIFKDITGDTFHQTLNRHRIETACMLLRESNYSIETIATETGFLDSKSFCRVFKQFMGKSAGEYRKSLKNKL